MPASLPPKATSRRLPALIAAAVAGLLLTAGWMTWSAWRSADLRTRARVAARRADWAAASAFLDRLAWYNPGDEEILRLQVRAAIGRGDSVDAARFLGRLPSTSPGAVEARMRQGRLLIEAFRPREAEAAFRDCLRLDPDADAARLALIAILAVQHRSRDYELEAWALFERGGEPIKALRLLAQAAPAIPPDTFTRTADLGDVLRRCMDADPDDPYTRLALARFERDRGSIDEALRLVEPCLCDPSAGPAATLEWIACLLDEGELDRLRPIFEHPTTASNELGSFWLLRGEWARRTGLNGVAIDNFRRAIRLDPRSADAHYRLGLALRDAGAESARSMEIARKAHALKDVVAQVSDHSHDPAQLTRVGRLCAEIGRDREARAWFTLALRSDPGHAEARSALDGLGLKPGLHDGGPASVSPR